jgi:integrase
MQHRTLRQLSETHREPTNAPLTVDDLAEWYLEDSGLHGYRSIRQARRHAALPRKTFGGIPISAITTAHIREFQIARRQTRVGRVLPISSPLKDVLERRLQQRHSHDRLVFKRGDLSQRAWQASWRDACRRAGVPNRLLHDCRPTAARNLIRAGVPERVAMLFTGHKTRAIFDRYNIVDERELAAAGDRLADYIGRIASGAG